MSQGKGHATYATKLPAIEVQAPPPVQFYLRRASFVATAPYKKGNVI